MYAVYLLALLLVINLAIWKNSNAEADHGGAEVGIEKRQGESPVEMAVLREKRGKRRGERREKKQNRKERRKNKKESRKGKKRRRKEKKSLCFKENAVKYIKSEGNGKRQRKEGRKYAERICRLKQLESRGKDAKLNKILGKWLTSANKVKNRVAADFEARGNKPVSINPGPIVEPQPPGPIVEPQPPGPIVEPQPPGPIVEPQPPGPIVEPQPPGPIVEPQPGPNPIIVTSKPFPPDDVSSQYIYSSEYSTEEEDDY